MEARKQRGIQDAAGRAPSRAIPNGGALLAAGTANQTKLVGVPVGGPLYEFAPAIDEYLKTHLFGAIFERDNLDWQSRELATVRMLSALPGTEAQLQARTRISMNVGRTASQLRQVAQVLADRVDAESSRRARGADAATGFPIIALTCACRPKLERSRPAKMVDACEHSGIVGGRGSHLQLRGGGG